MQRVASAGKVAYVWLWFRPDWLKIQEINCDWLELLPRVLKRNQLLSVEKAKPNKIETLINMAVFDFPTVVGKTFRNACS